MNEFEIPNIILTREDVEWFLKSRRKDVDAINISRNISDEKMRIIAEYLSEYLSENWSQYFEAIYDASPNLFEVTRNDFVRGEK